MKPKSSTISIPETAKIPHHLAVIMDGNGRWATKKFLPRTAGHAKGLQAVRRLVELCGKKGIKYLTLFAFSSENWRRPAEEVSMLMRLFIQTLEKEVDKLQKQGVRLRIIGDINAFEPKLQKLILQAQELTKNNNALHLTIAANYGGRWDILQAAQKAFAKNPNLINDTSKLQEQDLSEHLSMAFAPEPDLFIRTGGEQRISNFLIWQLAYTELYFTDDYWPDFGAKQLDQAIEWYSNRERRFGRTSQQLESNQT